MYLAILDKLMVNAAPAGNIARACGMASRCSAMTERPSAPIAG